MRKKVGRFLTCYGLYLLAVYAPAVLWVQSLAHGGSVLWCFLISPILFVATLLWITDPGTALSILIAGWLLLGFLAAISCDTRRARFYVAGALFLCSLGQGLYAAAFIAGIDAIGKS